MAEHSEENTGAAPSRLAADSSAAASLTTNCAGDDDGPTGRAGEGLGAWMPGQVILDEFEVERELGRGGMGTVYLVRNRKTGEEYAVKRALFSDATSQRNFLSELETWITLPNHPHIAACRSPRILGNETLIFAEYVAGGSLAEWIRDRKLTSLEQILDVAIQLAWGRHALHEAGFIHQDVKPGNTLLTPEGIVKVTDFGLARARASTEQNGPSSTATRLGSYGGRTPAYCSPEQAEIALGTTNAQKLSRQTDIWSWGITVLEMFWGVNRCVCGQLAPNVLEDYLTSNEKDGVLPIPPEIIEVLQKCFKINPQDRWRTLIIAAERLRYISRDLTGRNYVRQMPAANMPTVPPRRRLQVLAQEYMKTGVQEIHQKKYQSATAWIDQSIHLYERLVTEHKWIEIIPELAITYLHKADAVSILPDGYSEAVKLFDQAIKRLERCIHRDYHVEHAYQLAIAYLKKAIVLAKNYNYDLLMLYRKAIRILRRLVKNETSKTPEEFVSAHLHNPDLIIYLHDVADIHIGSIAAYKRLLENTFVPVKEVISDLSDVAQLCVMPIAIYERLVTEGRNELKDKIAKSYSSLAHASREAAHIILQASDVFQIPEKRSAAVGLYDNALVYLNNAFLLGESTHNLVDLYNMALDICERLTSEGREERPELRCPDLSWAYRMAKRAEAEAPAQTKRAEAVGLARAKRAEAEALAQAEREKAEAEALARTKRAEACVLAQSERVEAEARAEEIARLKRVETEAREVALAEAKRAEAEALVATSITKYEEAIEILESLIIDEGRFAPPNHHRMFTKKQMLREPVAKKVACHIHEIGSEHVNELAETYLAKGATEHQLGNDLAAVESYARAITLYSKMIMISRDCRKEWLGQLALACSNKAISLVQVGKKRTAMRMYDRAIAIWEEMVPISPWNRLNKGEQMHKWVTSFAETLIARVRSLSKRKRELARTDVRRAIALLESEIHNQPNMQAVLDEARILLSELI